MFGGKHGDSNMTTPGVLLWLAVAAIVSFGVEPSRPIPLQCTLAAHSEGRFELTLRNVSVLPLDGEFLPAVELKSTPPGAGGWYWAPVDLSTGQTYGPNQPRRIALQPGEATTVVFAPKALLWDHTISSVWPRRPLSQIVPAGRYTLSVRVQEHKTAERTVSNRLVVVQQDGDLRVDTRAR
jgi:hypothetical protein